MIVLLCDYRFYLEWVGGAKVLGNTTVKLFRHLYTTVLLHSSEEVALGVLWDFFGLAYLYLMGN